MYQYFDRCRVTTLQIFLRDLLPVDAYEQFVEARVLAQDVKIRSQREVEDLVGSESSRTLSPLD